MKWPIKKRVMYGNTKVCFAFQSKAFRLWAMGKSYLRKNNQEAADNCFSLAKEAAKEADLSASKTYKKDCE